MFEIDLNKYFYTTRKYYSFFDAIAKEKEGLKRDKIKDLGIVYSTYRANKLKENSPSLFLLFYYTQNCVCGMGFADVILKLY